MNELARIIRLVRRRYRLRVFLRGALIVAAAAFALFVISAYVLEQFRFEPGAVIATRILFFAGLAALALRYLVMPLTRRVTDEQVALYIEEHEPSLEAAIVSAVQHGGNAGIGSPSLVRRLVEGAVESARAVEDGRRIERKPLRLLPAAIGGVAVVAIAAALGGPDFFRHALTAVFRPWSDAAAAAPYAIRVEPGNALVARGGDQRIAAALRNFDADEVRIMIRRSDTSAWEALAMGADSAPGTYMAHLFDLEAPLLYYVEAAGVRSGTYRLDVRDLPYARQVDLEYRFPSYTGLPVQTVENGGDVAALRGTVVQLRVTPTIATTGGRIVIEGAEPVPLTPDSSGALRGQFQVARDGFYRIELAAEDGTLVPASLQYVIEVLPDRAPSIEIVRPGRDSRVTSLEEVFIEARAEDDYGIARLELVFSVNGGPEQTVALHGGRSRKEVSAGHTLFLEDHSLEPGDIVSYHARALDGNPYGGPGRAATDIYFLQVRPFDREYRQAEASGMPGEGGDTPEGLSEQQREIVAATFKSARDRATTPAAEFRENVATISLAQGRLRDRVDILAKRLVQRGIAASDSTFAKIAAELPHAVEAMRVAEGQLAKRDAQGALPPEQKALQHLLRAEAAFREVQVTRGQQQGQGSGQQSNAEDLADLFELENDRLENQYETVQRGREEAARQQVDEAMERLKQLASRQQQENERLRREAERMQQQSGGSGGSTSQRQLAAEADSLARQLERLAREQSSQELRQSARQLQQAADAMRRSAARSEQGGAAQGTNALQRLEEARRLLDRGASSRAEEQTRAAAERARRAAEEQRSIAAEAERLQPGDAAGRQRLEQRKDRLAGEVGELERELDRAARDTRRDHREAARRLQEATTELRDRRVREKIEYSKRLLGSGVEGSRAFEEGISANLERVREAAEAASESIGEPEGRRAERAIERARELARGTESLAERAAEGQRDGQDGPDGQDGRDGRDGQQAQPGQAESQSGEARTGREQTGTPSQIGGGQARPGQDRIGDAPTSDGRQLSRELRQRRLDAERLRQELAQQGVDVRDLDRIIGEMRRLEGAAIGTDRRAAERLESEVVQGLKDFEFSVRRALGADDENRPRLGRQDAVPPEYRELVEKYYESLAR